MISIRCYYLVSCWTLLKNKIFGITKRSSLPTRLAIVSASKFCGFGETRNWRCSSSILEKKFFFIGVSFFKGRRYFRSRTLLLYLSGLNKMEGLLTKNNWLRFPPKPKEAKLNIVGGDLFWIITSTDPTIDYIMKKYLNNKNNWMIFK